MQRGPRFNQSQSPLKDFLSKSKVWHWVGLAGIASIFMLVYSYEVTQEKMKVTPETVYKEVFATRLTNIEDFSRRHRYRCHFQYLLSLSIARGVELRDPDSFEKGYQKEMANQLVLRSHTN